PGPGTASRCCCGSTRAASPGWKTCGLPGWKPPSARQPPSRTTRDSDPKQALNTPSASSEPETPGKTTTARSADEVEFDSAFEAFDSAFESLARLRLDTYWTQTPA